MAINNKFRVKNGLTVGGDIDLTGTIDGRDLAVDGAKLDGIETGATADQTKADIDALNIDADTLDGQHGSYYAPQSTTYTKTETDTAISNLVAAAPATLDTLNELAAALGDDPNFATTVTNSIATKAPKASPSFTGNITVTGTVDGRDIAADGTKLDGVETGATADQTAAQILTSLKTVDGSGSGLDADLLDGLNSSSFVRTDTSSSITGDLDVTGSIGVGTSTPEQLLHAKSGDTPVLRLEQDSSSGWGAQTWDIGGNESKFFIRDINGGTLPFMIKAGALQSTLYISIGGVGIGTTTPLGRFDVRNTSNTTSYLNVATDGKIGLGITSVGATNALQHSNGAHLTSSGTWNSVSDIRIKENIEVIPDALNKVMQLRGITYDRIGMDVTRDTGVIAQELMAVLPEAVSGGPTEDSPEDIYGVAYGNMAGMFVEAIKEQQVIVASQKAEIDELRVLLSAVTARLDGAGL